jgi:DNA uptake protein ComE-like DNA-binding protein
MATPAERKALAFLAALTLLGSGVRVVRALGIRPEPDATAHAALDRQIAAVDSVQAAAAARQGVERSRRRRAPRRRAQSTSSPPSPPPVVVAVPDPTTKVDMDIASAADIERLPKIGPVLARRIVADRDSLGAFGSLRGLQRVKGVGPALANALAPHVTFSGTPRPSDVNERDRDTPGRTRRRPRPRPP